MKQVTLAEWVSAILGEATSIDWDRMAEKDRQDHIRGWTESILRKVRRGARRRK